MKIGSLFTGAGMLDEGVRSVLGGEVAWHVEYDAAASKVLAHHYPTVPNFGDVTTVDWREIEPIDVLTGGFPCQDVSSAGRREGLRAGENRSGLWASMLDAIEVLQPRLVVAENVRGLLSAKTDTSRDVVTTGPKGGRKVGRTDRALGRVLADLADIGYDAAWCGLRAADVGAPHGRFRVFIGAWPAVEDADISVGGEWRQSAPGEAESRRARADIGGRSGTPSSYTPRNPWGFVNGDGSATTDADEPGSQGRESAQRRNLPAWRDSTSTDTSSQRFGQHAGTTPTKEARQDAGDITAGDRRSRATANWGPYRHAVERWERLTRVAPAPTELAPRGGQRLSPRFTEWMQGWPLDWVNVEGVSRNDQLKICGNGVVPQQTAEALRRLLPFVVEHEAKEAA